MWAYEVTLAPNVVNNGGKKHPQEQNSHLRQVTIWGGGLRDANAYLPYYFYYDGKNGSILQPGDVTP